MNRLAKDHAVHEARRGKKVGVPITACLRGQGILLVTVHRGMNHPVGDVEITLQETGTTSITRRDTPARFSDLRSGHYTVGIRSDLSSRSLRQRPGPTTQRCRVRVGEVTCVNFDVEDIARSRIEVTPAHGAFGAAWKLLGRERQIFTVKNVGEAPLTLQEVTALPEGGAFSVLPEGGAFSVLPEGGPFSVLPEGGSFSVLPEGGPISVVEPFVRWRPIPVGESMTLTIECQARAAPGVTGSLRVTSDAANVSEWRSRLTTPPSRQSASKVALFEDDHVTEPFRARDALVHENPLDYASGFTAQVEAALIDFAARLRAGYQDLPDQFQEQLDDSLNVPRAPGISAILNAGTYWRAGLEAGGAAAADFARLRVDDNESGWYGTPLRERLSRRGRYDDYNDVLIEHLGRTGRHTVLVFEDIYAEARYIRRNRCYRVRHIRYPRTKFEAIMTRLDDVLREGLESEQRATVIACAGKITYYINHLTVTHRGQGAVSELLGLALLRARGIPIPPLTSRGKPIYPCGESIVTTAPDFVQRFSRWVTTGEWDFWYENNAYAPTRADAKADSATAPPG